MARTAVYVRVFALVALMAVAAPLAAMADCPDETVRGRASVHAARSLGGAAPSLNDVLCAHPHPTQPTNPNCACCPLCPADLLQERQRLHAGLVCDRPLLERRELHQPLRRPRRAGGLQAALARVHPGVAVQLRQPLWLPLSEWTAGFGSLEGMTLGM